MPKINLSPNSSSINFYGDCGGNNKMIEYDESTNDNNAYLFQSTDNPNFSFAKYNRDTQAYVGVSLAEILADIKNGIDYTFIVTDYEGSYYGEIPPNMVRLVRMNNGFYELYGERYLFEYDFAEDGETAYTKFNSTLFFLSEQDSFISTCSYSEWTSNGDVIHDVFSRGWVAFSETPLSDDGD